MCYPPRKTIKIGGKPCSRTKPRTHYVYDRTYPFRIWRESYRKRGGGRHILSQISTADIFLGGRSRIERAGGEVSAGWDREKRVHLHPTPLHSYPVRKLSENFSSTRASRSVSPCLGVRRACAFVFHSSSSSQLLPESVTGQRKNVIQWLTPA